MRREQNEATSQDRSLLRRALMYARLALFLFGIPIMGVALLTALATGFWWSLNAVSIAEIVASLIVVAGMTSSGDNE